MYISVLFRVPAPRVTHPDISISSSRIELSSPQCLLCPGGFGWSGLPPTVNPNKCALVRTVLRRGGLRTEELAKRNVVRAVETAVYKY